MKKKIFHFIMIKPSHYDDDGYVIQFFRSAMPSNTLATMYGLASDCRRRKVLGEDVDIRLTAIDETNKRIKVKKLVRKLRRDGGLGLVGLVGVQSNQFPRAMDLARQFRAENIDVCIGGYHVSGCLAMISGLPPELKAAIDEGVSLFAGEAENRLETVLRDAYAGELRHVYNYMADLPPLQDVPIPILDAKTVKRTGGGQSSFDAGRGCPFMCSFCTIINVQGRKSRYRSADDVEHIVRENLKQGIRRFFITDDNFARNQNWEAIFDRLIELRRKLNASINLVLQVDTMCHRIPNFIEKAALAGTKRVFIGLENINPDSLKSAKKGQNRITEYRQMLHAWRDVRVITTAGYILGFPNDTPDTIVRDIEIIKRELPIDILEFFYLTPLPGSADHKGLYENGVPLDPDLNKYDLNHVTTGHDKMNKEEWEKAYRLAWDTFFTDDHIVTLLKRARASDLSLGKILSTITWFYGSVMYEDVHPLESGVIRYKFRRDRRPEFPIVSPWRFYPQYLADLVSKTSKTLALYMKYAPLRRRLDLDGDAVDYTDVSLEPVSADSEDDLEMFKVTEAAGSALARAKRRAGVTAAQHQ
ncbi:MAG: radical SAM protein [Woeseiaceae bacterium]|nr:radical SAM protein [Woeseiaceae bacterium]